MNNYLSRLIAQLVKPTCLLATVLLTACGGGGTGSSDADIAQGVASKTSSVSFVKSGVITGFGSIIVDGQRIATDTVRTIANGNASDDIQMLKVGMKVSVLADKGDDDEVSAQDIYYDADLDGVISSIDRANQQLLLQEIAVDFNDLTHFIDTSIATLAVGDRVEVSGYMQSSGILLATYIELENNVAQQAESLSVSGEITQLDNIAQSLSIGLVNITYVSEQILADLAIGQSVRVYGTVVSGVLQAQQITRLESDDLYSKDESENHYDYLEIEGFVTSYDASAATLFIDGRSLTLSANVASTSTIAAGDFVEVYLDAQSNKVTKIEVKNQKQRVDGKVKGKIEAIGTNPQSITTQSQTYRIDTNTRFEEDDDQYFNFESLLVGDFVEISFVKIDTENFVQRIEREDFHEFEEDSELKGQLTSFDEETRQLVISGVLVKLSDNPYFISDDTKITEAEFFLLATSQSCSNKIEVEGVYSADGIFQARFIECETNRSDTSSESDNDDAHSNNDGNESGSDSNDSLLDSDDDSFSNTNNEGASESEEDHGRKENDRGYFELEGHISEILSDTTFVISRREVRIDTTTKFESNDQNITIEAFKMRLTTGLKIEVEGFWVDSTYVLATQIEIEEE